jgi:catechol 2,3-dioxygenase-like lactoylglutathione lyase family enzyme
MAITGILEITYGVQDLEAGIRFYEDFGLALSHRDERSADFLLPDGSSVRLRRADDPLLPPAFETGPGVRQVVWAVDSVESLDALERSLGTDRKVVRAGDTLFLQDDVGLPIGLRVAKLKPVSSPPEVTNAPGRVERWNRHRQWYERAEPKLMQHVVFCHPDVRKAAAFYVKRLNFRISDIQDGAGYFLRADGRNEHHNIFWQPGRALGFRHVAFGVENIDELMVGAGQMQRRGYKSAVGLGRHRISSTFFFYFESPCGGESEYSTDTDYLDDEWRPRVWGRAFGYIYWASRVSEKVPAREVRLATAADLEL